MTMITNKKDVEPLPTVIMTYHSHLAHESETVPNSIAFHRASVYSYSSLW